MTTYLVLGGFAITLVYGYWALAPTEQRATAVVVNALPSAKHLSAARSAMTDLEDAIRSALLPEGMGAHVAKDVAAARSRLGAAVAGELATPQFPGEQALHDEMLEALAEFDTRTADLLAARAAPLEVRVARFRDWLAADTRVDSVLARLTRLNLDQGEVEARTILGIQRRAEQITLVMFAGTLLVATVAAALTLRLLRQTDREAAIHERFLQDRADELEAFAGRVAHDLKDPLAVLSMRLGIMRSHMDDDTRKLGGALDKASVQVARMDEVIRSLLEFARAGGQPSTDARAELGDVMAQVVEDLAPAAATAHVELHVDPFPPEQLACTPGALSSVLHNLVGNAIKYIVDGRAPVREIRLHVADQPENVRVEVKDNGPGLPPGAEQTVFEPFVRLGRTKQAGTGLGLATVRRIVEAYGGRVGVVAEPGAGSCFWFEMPKAHAQA